MIVLDASVLIAHLDSDDLQHGAAGALLAENATEAFRASPMTLAEVLTGPARAGQLDRASAVLEQLEIESVPLPADAPRRLALLRASTALKLPDCVVLLAAETAGAAVASFDERLCAAARQRGQAVCTIPL
ncbi:MAG: type II toxin-antitoxin system VapC family toxin [Candidatus Dormibacteria bacterium]